MALNLVITDAGRAALVNARNDGTRAVRVVAAGVSSTAIVAAPGATTLPGEIKRITTLGGAQVAADIIHLVVQDESMDSYPLRSFALYLDTGVLFALYGQPTPILEKSAQALMLVQADVKLADITADTITFGDANFLNPPSTTERAGVVELSTVQEARAGEDAARAITPAVARQAVTDWIGYPPVQQGTGIGQRLNSVKVGWLGTGIGVGVTVDQTDLGPIVFAAAIADVWRTSNDGAGSGLDADLLDGQQGSWYANVPARLGYTPIQQGTGLGQMVNTIKIGWMGTGVGLGATVDNTNLGLFVFAGSITDVWRSSNDGAGSGLDADLLDGQQGSWYGDVPARLGYTPIQQGTGTGQKSNTVKIGYMGPGVGLGVVVDNTNLGLVVFDSAIADVWRSSNDGSGSGLDADLLDGQQGSWYGDVPARLGYTPIQQGTGTGQKSNTVKIGYMGPGVGLGVVVDNTNLGLVVFDSAIADVWRSSNDGSGSGLDADLLDGQQGSWYGDVPARLGYTPIQQGTGIGQRPNAVKIGWLGGGVGVTVDTTDFGAIVFESSVADVWRSSNDGAGSGLDADLLDGRQATEFALTSAFSSSLGANGYQVLPGGLILQWCSGFANNSGSEPTQTITFPITFPNACLRAFVSTGLETASIRADAFFQLVGAPSNGSVTVQRQVTAQGTDDRPTTPLIFALGF